MISLKNKRVIIVEDDEWLAEQFAATLQRQGAICDVSPFAEDALVKIDQHIPDVIILDMLLTGSTGLVLLHELQSHTDLAKIPVILCTTIADTLEISSLAAYGVRRILDKTTMHPDDIIAATRSVLA